MSCRVDFSITGATGLAFFALCGLLSQPGEAQQVDTQTAPRTTWESFRGKCEENSRFNKTIGEAIAKAAEDEWKLFGLQEIDGNGRLMKAGLVEFEQDTNQEKVSEISLSQLGWWHVCKYWRYLNKEPDFNTAKFIKANQLTAIQKLFPAGLGFIAYEDARRTNKPQKVKLVGAAVFDEYGNVTPGVVDENRRGFYKYTADNVYWGKKIPSHANLPGKRNSVLFRQGSAITCSRRIFTGMFFIEPCSLARRCKPLRNQMTTSIYSAPLWRALTRQNCAKH